MWPFRKKREEERQFDGCRSCGYSEAESIILAHWGHAVQDKVMLWRSNPRAENKRWCPYCNGVVVEISEYKKIKPCGSSRAVPGASQVHCGFFCLTCGGEMVCGERGCKYEVGDILPRGESHLNATNPHHESVKIKTAKGARNLFDLLDRLEVHDKVLGAIDQLDSIKVAEDEPDIQDEYTKLETRLEEIAAEDARIRARMHEINIVFAEEALEASEPPDKLLRAADGDKEIIAEAEAEVEGLTTVDKE